MNTDDRRSEFLAEFAQMTEDQRTTRLAMALRWLTAIMEWKARQVSMGADN